MLLRARLKKTDMSPEKKVSSFTFYIHRYRYVYLGNRVLNVALGI